MFSHIDESSSEKLVHHYVFIEQIFSFCCHVMTSHLVKYLIDFLCRDEIHSIFKMLNVQSDYHASANIFIIIHVLDFLFHNDIFHTTSHNCVLCVEDFNDHSS